MSKKKGVKQKSAAVNRPGVGGSMKSNPVTTDKMDSPGIILPEYVYLVLMVLFAASYWMYSTVNHGFHMHDGVSHYLSIRSFWDDPWSMLNIWQKPGYKFFFSPFASMGRPFLIWLHCFCVAGAAYFTGRVVKLIGLPGLRLPAMLLVAYQPIVWQTAFRFHSENFVALLLSLVLLAYFSKRYAIAGLLLSYAMITRFELGLIAAIVGLVFLVRKKWLAFILLGTFPVLIDIAGFIKTGHPLFFFTDMLFTGAKYEYTQFGFFYNWRMLPPATGIILIGLALIGMFPVGEGWQKFRQHLGKYHILYIYFLSIFLSFCLFTSPWFKLMSLQAQDQSYVQFAPALAIFGVLGLDQIIRGNQRAVQTGLFISIVYTLGLASYLTVRYDHPNGFTNIPEYSYLLMAVVLTVVLIIYTMRRYSPLLLIGLLSIVFMGHTFYIEKAPELRPEEVLCQQVADWYHQNQLDTMVVLCNHNIFHYYADNKVTKNGKARHMRWWQVQEAPKGALILWDSHYGYNPKFEETRNVPLDSLLKRPDKYRMITKQPFVTPDRTFGIYPFIKISEAEKSDHSSD